MVSGMVPLEVVVDLLSRVKEWVREDNVGMVTVRYCQALGCMGWISGCRVCCRLWEGLGENCSGIVGF